MQIANFSLNRGEMIFVHASECFEKHLVPRMFSSGKREDPGDEVWEEVEEIPLPHHCGEQLCREHKYSIEGIHDRKFANHREDDTTCYKP